MHASTQGICAIAALEDGVSVLFVPSSQYLLRWLGTLPLRSAIDCSGAPHLFRMTLERGQIVVFNYRLLRAADVGAPGKAHAHIQWRPVECNPTFCSGLPPEWHAAMPDVRPFPWC